MLSLGQSALAVPVATLPHDARDGLGQKFDLPLDKVLPKHAFQRVGIECSFVESDARFGTESSLLRSTGDNSSRNVEPQRSLRAEDRTEGPERPNLLRKQLMNEPPGTRAEQLPRKWVQFGQSYVQSRRNRDGALERSSADGRRAVPQ